MYSHMKKKKPNSVYLIIKYHSHIKGKKPKNSVYLSSHIICFFIKSHNT